MSVSIMCYIVHQTLLLMCVVTQFVVMFFSVTCPAHASLKVNTVYSGDFFFNCVVGILCPEEAQI